MRKENVRCPMCGTMNYDVDLDATDGWTNAVFVQSSNSALWMSGKSIQCPFRC